MRGRLNATSVMVVAPDFNAFEAQALTALNATKPRAAIGLHVVLSAPFRPLSAGFTPLRDGAFPALHRVLLAAMRRSLDAAALRAEVDSQLAAFARAFGRAPDFIDGHQHVQLFPQIDEAVLAAAKAHAPQAWLRQCGRATPLTARLGNGKALLLDTLEPAISPPRHGGGRADQYGVRRRLWVRRGRRLRQAVRAFSQSSAGRRPDHVPSGFRRCDACGGSIR